MSLTISQPISTQQYASNATNTINSTNNTQPPPPPPPPQGDSALTEDQSSSLTELLSQFDADNLSSSDIEKLHESFKALDISPSKEFADTLEENGFSLEQLKPQDGSQMPPMMIDIQA